MPVNPDTRRQIAAMRDRGHGYQTIARALNANQVPTASGAGRWYPASARAALYPGYWAVYQRQRRAR